MGNAIFHWFLGKISTNTAALFRQVPTPGKDFQHLSLKGFSSSATKIEQAKFQAAQ